MWRRAGPTRSTMSISPAAIRRVKSDIPSYDDLHLPPIYGELIDKTTEGLFLVVGVTGSGKSSLIAALAGVRMFLFSGKEREATEQSERNRETHSYSPPLSNSTNRR